VRACKKQFIGGKYFPHNGQPYCRSDFENLCVKCDKVIADGDMKTFKGLNYHASCIRCALCRKSLATEKIFELNDKPYCKSDFDLESRISSKGKSRSSSSSLLSSDPPSSTTTSTASANTSSYTTSAVVVSNKSTSTRSEPPPPSSTSSSSLNQPLQKCEYCGEEIQGKKIEIGVKMYHDACWKCSACFTPIPADAEFKQGKHGIICLSCSSRTCSVCHQVIPEGETVVDFHGDKMHANCFRCCKCKCVLTSSTLYELRRQPYCLRDYSSARAAK